MNLLVDGWTGFLTDGKGNYYKEIFPEQAEDFPFLELKNWDGYPKYYVSVPKDLTKRD